MKKTFLALLMAALFLAPSPAQARVSFDFFFETLDPYGEWIDVAEYGHCWRPIGVDADWRPYADGYWSYTDAGWTWVSYEDWGGVTYHYGRWVYLQDEGWCWVPGYEWGPAWVSWRYSDDYIGWAPLPPEARFRPDIGISVWVDRTYDIGPAYYNFCRVRQFGAPVLRGVIVDRRENVTIINQTVNITNITVNTTKRVVYNGGPDYNRVSSRAERTIPALRLVQQNEVDSHRHSGPGRHRPMRAERKGNQLLVAAPELEAPSQKLQLPAKVVSNPRIDRGWGEIKDPQLRSKIKKGIERETLGLTPENAPAKPMVSAVLPQPVQDQAGASISPEPLRDAGDAMQGVPERPDRSEREQARRDAVEMPSAVPAESEAPQSVSPAVEKPARRMPRRPDAEETVAPGNPAVVQPVPEEKVETVRPVEDRPIVAAEPVPRVQAPESVSPAIEKPAHRTSKKTDTEQVMEPGVPVVVPTPERTQVPEQPPEAPSASRSVPEAAQPLRVPEIREAHRQVIQTTEKSDRRRGSDQRSEQFEIRGDRRGAAQEERDVRRAMREQQAAQREALRSQRSELERIRPNAHLQEPQAAEVGSQERHARGSNLELRLREDAQIRQLEKRLRGGAKREKEEKD